MSSTEQKKWYEVKKLEISEQIGDIAESDNID